MKSFQKIILIIAIVILLLALLFIGITLSKGIQQQQWPPIISDCPDYWTIDGSGNNTHCINTHNLGTCSAKENRIMNFNTPTFTGANGLCNKYNWANNCNISWDGITYGVNNPCQSSS